MRTSSPHPGPLPSEWEREKEKELVACWRDWKFDGHDDFIAGGGVGAR